MNMRRNDTNAQPDSAHAPPVPRQADVIAGVQAPRPSVKVSAYGTAPGYGTMPGYGHPWLGAGAEPHGGIGNPVATLWRHKLPVLFCIVAALGLAAWYVRTTTPVYKSEALVELSVRRPRIMRQEEALIEESRTQVEDLRNAQIAKLKTETLRARVVGRALADWGPGADRGRVKDAVKAVEVTPQRRSTLVAIVARDPDPVRAAALANLYAQEALRYALEGNRTLSDEAVRWLETQAESQHMKLKADEEALLLFRTEQKADAIQAQQTLSRAVMADINAQLTGILARKVEQEELLKALEALAKIPAATRALPTATPGMPEISALLAAHQKLRAEEAALLRDYTEQHPTVTAKRAEGLTAEAELRRLFAQALETVRANVALLDRQQSNLRRESEAQAANSVLLENAIHRAQAGIAALERDRDVSEAMYRGILNRIEEARISADEETAAIKIVEPARPPQSPAEPRAARILALALLLGGAAGVGMAFLAAFLQDRIWSPNDIEGSCGDLSGLKMILGIVPRAERKLRNDMEHMVERHPFDRVSESFAVLRSALATRMSGKTLMVTSPGPHEGKTTCACNLAIAYAQAGRRVLLLDLDLRRPRLASIWGISAQDQSLLHALADEAEPDFPALVHETHVANLHVVVSHPSRRISPSQVLAGDRANVLLTWAAQHYDIVIVDTPPVGVAADALCVARHASTVLLVVRFNSTPKRSLQAAWDRLLDCQVLPGVVVNDVAFARHATFGCRHPWYTYYSGYHAYGQYAAAKAQTPESGRDTTPLRP